MKNNTLAFLSEPSAMSSSHNVRWLNGLQRSLWLALVLGLVSVASYVWLDTQRQLAMHTQSQAQQLGLALVDQYQSLLTPFLADGDQQQVQRLMETLVSNSQVLSATVFDSTGRPLARGPGSISYMQLHQTSPPLTLHPLVRDIQFEDQSLGYLRVVVDASPTHAVMAEIQGAYWSRGLILCALMLLAGILLNGVWAQITHWRKLNHS